MRKKSHISLACYLVNAIPTDDLTRHKKAFCIGSILPDCKPSFFTKKHEFDKTFDLVESGIKRLSEENYKNQKSTRAYIRLLGEVIHYMADYFTFPHNVTYEGNLKDHCRYEENLKIGLRSYIRSGDAKKEQKDVILFADLEELLNYIKDAHNEYLSHSRNVEQDCRYIVQVTYQVVNGIHQLYESNFSQELCMA